MTTHTTIFAGYQYQKQSFGELGLRFLFLKNDNFIYRVGASSLIGSVNDKLSFVPKLQADVLINTEKNADIQHSYYFLTGAEITTQSIAPKVGISLFGIVDFSVGYAFAFGNNTLNGKKIDELNANFTFNIPLVIFAN
jgi:hypothetical protein